MLIRGRKKVGKFESWFAVENFFSNPSSGMLYTADSYPVVSKALETDLDS